MHIVKLFFFFLAPCDVFQTQPAVVICFCISGHDKQDNYSKLWHWRATLTFLYVMTLKKAGLFKKTCLFSSISTFSWCVISGWSSDLLSCCGPGVCLSILPPLDPADHIIEKQAKSFYITSNNTGWSFICTTNAHVALPNSTPINHASQKISTWLTLWLQQATKWFWKMLNQS